MLESAVHTQVNTSSSPCSSFCKTMPSFSSFICHQPWHAVRVNVVSAVDANIVPEMSPGITPSVCFSHSFIPIATISGTNFYPDMSSQIPTSPDVTSTVPASFSAIVLGASCLPVLVLISSGTPVFSMMTGCQHAILVNILALTLGLVEHL